MVLNVTVKDISLSSCLDIVQTGPGAVVTFLGMGVSIYNAFTLASWFCVS